MDREDILNLYVVRNSCPYRRVRYQRQLLTSTTTYHSKDWISYDLIVTSVRFAFPHAKQTGSIAWRLG